MLKVPQKIECFNEIATQYDSQLPAVYNVLTSQERIFIYYMFRANLPGHRICADQMHRHAIDIIELFEYILERSSTLKELKLATIDLDTFLQNVKTYLVYLWTNHGQYFAKEHANEKRTPDRLGLTALTSDNLVQVLQALGYENAQAAVQQLAPSIFDHSIESTLCIPDNIEGSAGNIYAPDFTAEDYQAIPAKDRTHINAYFFVEKKDDRRIPRIQLYKVGGKYTHELEVSVHWLKKAHEHAQRYPQTFDKNLVKSLEYLIMFLQTGDETWFKKHSIEWLKTHSRVDYLFGFIETYKDPKSFRGTFEAEVTVKTMDMQVLNALLPSLEQQLPFPQQFKRQNLDDITAIPNASINRMIVGSGDAGPLRITSAYCLPNYGEIRAQYGSKQVIYEVDKDLGELLNLQLYKKLFTIQKQVAWLEQYDSDMQLHRDIWRVHCVLHETLGHGSGRFDKHIFKEGDPLTIDNVTYKIGDSIEVTDKNKSVFLGEYSASLEELRAEIIALYTSIFMFDDLAQKGLFNNWPVTIGKEALIEQFVLDMAWTGLRRLLTQSDETTEIAGAHAQANTTIMNYLIDNGGLEFVEEQVVVNDTPHTVLGFCISDIKKVCDSITQLMINVQRIKSTADGIALKELINTYGRYVRKPEYVTVLKNNLKAVVGDLKVSARIFPQFSPVIDKTTQEIIDINATWPANIIDQWMEYKKLALSKE